MPYISETERNDSQVEALRDVIQSMRFTPGRMAYAIALMVSELRDDMAAASMGSHTWGINCPPLTGYDALALIDGVLGTAQAEFRERVLKPYEKAKRKENGDVLLADRLSPSSAVRGRYGLPPQPPGPEGRPGRESEWKTTKGESGSSRS